MAKTRTTKKSRETLTVARIEKALLAAGGFKSYAAQLLGVTTRCLYDYFDKYPELEDILEDIECAKLDTSEMQLFKKIRKGDGSSIQFHLTYKGRGRGYIRQTQNLNINADAEKEPWSQVVKQVTQDAQKSGNRE